MKNILNIKIAGAAGQGVESGGQGLTKVAKRYGLHVFGVSDFMSLIKGGHNFYQLSISNREIYSHNDKFHVLVCFDPQNINENIAHIKELYENGIFIVDDSVKLASEYTQALEEQKAILCQMPLNKLATEVGGNKIMANTVALGGVISFLDIPFEFLDKVVRQNFAKKSQEIADQNSAVAKAGYDYVANNLKNKFKFQAVKPDNKEIAEKTGSKMLINGNEAIAMGAYAGGCRFISAYPMTPGTSVFEWFTKRASKLGVVAKHTEDEIASICMAIGASHVGARAMTTTSGGGFCLMVEGLGLAGMTETPVVVVNVMRGGPSTGLPTRTEQPDLLFAINSSHGEFPKIVLTPCTTEECYEAGLRAHNLAYKYQMPVIILSDTYLSVSIRDTHSQDYFVPEIEQGKFVSKEDLDKLSPDQEYLRFKFTEDGVSPRALPGHPKAVYAPPTDEHDETGHITDNQENRIKMMSKRMQKLETARAEIKGPKFYGPDKADLTLVCWGSVYGATREAVDLFNSEKANSGQKINLLYFSELWPFPKEKTLEAFKNIKNTLFVEQNYTGQLASLIKLETGYEAKNNFNKFDGRPVTPQEISQKASEILKKLLIKA